MNITPFLSLDAITAAARCLPSGLNRTDRTKPFWINLRTNVTSSAGLAVTSCLANQRGILGKGFCLMALPGVDGMGSIDRDLFFDFSGISGLGAPELLGI